MWNVPPCLNQDPEVSKAVAAECARQEAVQTAKDIFKKGVDAATEQGREAILEKLPEIFSPEDNGDTPAD